MGREKKNIYQPPPQPSLSAGGSLDSLIRRLHRELTGKLFTSASPLLLFLCSVKRRIWRKDMVAEGEDGVVEEEEEEEGGRQTNRRRYALFNEFL